MVVALLQSGVARQPIGGFIDAAPTRTTVKASASWLFRGYRGASAPVAYASRMVLPGQTSGLPVNPENRYDQSSSGLIREIPDKEAS